MKIYVNLKTLGRNKRGVEPVPFILSAVPATAMELVRALAIQCAEDYNRRRTDPAPPQPMSRQQLAQLERVGRIGFGMLPGGGEADPAAAADTAAQAFADGLFRLYQNDGELTPESPVTLADGDVLTLIRLVMLTGTYF